MKSSIKYISVLFSLACVFSCVEEKFDDNLNTNDPNIIQFGIAKDSKTVYDESDPRQINWVSGDKISIYSAQALGDLKRADYSVTPSSDAKKDGTITAVTSSQQLKWGSDNAHTFYAVYPNDGGISIASDGRITFPSYHTQYVDFNPVDKIDTMYITKPRMSNYAYMVAKNTVNPLATPGPVFLNFKPIMTTLEVIVRGRKANLADVTVTGITIGFELPKNSNSTQFVYNVNGGTNGNGELEMQGTSSELKQETIFVGIKGPVNNGNAQDYVVLQPGEAVKLTVFIPPMEINGGKPIKIRVHATGNTEVVATLAAEIKPSSKRVIKLPAYPQASQTPTGNNWLTLLNDEIYVSQLSIPGTHDAATGDGTTFDLGKTQEKTLDEQFEMGIRAFDLRPARNSNGEIIIAHGLVATTYNWDAIMEKFKLFLENNPGEFVIIFFKHETEYATLNFITQPNSTAKWQSAMTTKLNAIKGVINPSTNKPYVIDFRPDLTIGDMRGRILFLCRDWTPYNNDKTTIVGGFTGWSHGPEGAEVDIYYNSTIKGKMNHQDTFSSNEAGSGDYVTIKWGAINNLLEKSRYFHTDPNMVNRWSLNHTSGYVGGTSTTNAYRENAANNHVKFYNKITGADWLGSTGIILSDFVGARKSGSYPVYGDLLPQAIIDNNYKFRMKRRGE